ncbi:hypothetical protein V8C86DRAFT_2593934 [Haematococcus lacustris]
MAGAGSVALSAGVAATPRLLVLLVPELVGCERPQGAGGGSCPRSGLPSSGLLAAASSPNPPVPAAGPRRPAPLLPPCPALYCPCPWLPPYCPCSPLAAPGAEWAAPWYPLCSPPNPA